MRTHMRMLTYLRLLPNYYCAAAWRGVLRVWVRTSAHACVRAHVCADFHGFTSKNSIRRKGDGVHSEILRSLRKDRHSSTRTQGIRSQSFPGRRRTWCKYVYTSGYIVQDNPHILTASLLSYHHRRDFPFFVPDFYPVEIARTPFIARSTEHGFEALHLFLGALIFLAACGAFENMKDHNLIPRNGAACTRTESVGLLGRKVRFWKGVVGRILPVRFVAALSCFMCSLRLNRSICFEPLPGQNASGHVLILQT